MLRLYLPFSSSAAADEGVTQLGSRTSPPPGHQYYGWKGKDYVFVIGTVETLNAVRLPAHLPTHLLTVKCS